MPLSRRHDPPARLTTRSLRCRPPCVRVISSETRPSLCRGRSSPTQRVSHLTSEKYTGEIGRWQLTRVSHPCRSSDECRGAAADGSLAEVARRAEQPPAPGSLRLSASKAFMRRSGLRTYMQGNRVDVRVLERRNHDRRNIQHTDDGHFLFIRWDGNIIKARAMFGLVVVGQQDVPIAIRT